MKLRLLYIYSFLCLASVACLAQETSSYNYTFENLDQATEYFDLGLYAQARTAITKHFEASNHISESERSISEYHKAKSIYYISGLHLGRAESEAELRNFINANYPNPLLNDAIFAIGNYYYNDKDYVQAIQYLDMLALEALTEEKMSEVAFKKGYCQFVRQEFQKSKSTLGNSKDVQNKYFYPVNYYYGMSEYFLGNYDDAVKSFQRVENNHVYQALIPYYIAQIYFVQGEYDELLGYGENIIQKTTTKRKKDIRLLLGQTYFIRNDYEKALPHLEFYEANSSQLTVEEFYQLAFSQYKLGLCEKAIDNFGELSLQVSKIGQVANYYLADCYNKIGDQNSSRAAFKKVSQMDYDKGMQEEATFNYGKLSAEQGFEREAINVLMAVPQNSPYFKEATSIINDILVNTGDFANAISIMESLPALNADLKETYQKVSFNYAIQKLAENDTDQARALFAKSEKYPFDKNLSTQVQFWEASILNNEGDYEESAKAFDTYFAMESSAGELPSESSLYVANYVQAYNLLKLEEYIPASDKFKNAITGINTNLNSITDYTIIDRMLPDAYARAGDCLFKVRRFDDAMTYYDQYIARKSPGYDYALYQRGIIEGLLDQPYEKILTMEELSEDHPTSEYADDALQQLGDTYLVLGSPIQAAGAFRKVLTDYGEKSNLRNAASLKLGLINYNEGDLEGALAYYKSIFQYNPSPKESQEAILAIEEIYIDDLAQTDEYFNFLKSVPGYEVSAFSKDSLNFRIGEIQYQNANYEKAIDGFSEYLKSYSQGYYRLDARYYRGESYALQKQYNKALKDYEVLINEGYSDYYERALKKSAIICYNHSQNFNKAFNYYQKWEELAKVPEDVYQSQLGTLRSAFRISNYDAVLAYGRKVSKNPLSSKEEKMAALYYLGKVAYNKKEYEKANDAFTRVSNEGTNNQSAESRYLLAKIAFEKGDFNEATKLANEANDKNASYPFWIAKSILLLSDIYVGNGHLLNARAAVEAVLENFKADKEIIDEANTKLSLIAKKEEDGNRIKTVNPNGNLELDTTGNK